MEAGVDEVSEFELEEGVKGAVAEVGGDGVEHVAVAVGEEGGGIPGAAAFFAHEGEVPDVFFDVGDEGGFDLHDGTVVEADLSDGEVFDGVGFVVPVGPGAGDCGGLVAHVGPDVSGGGDGARGAHDVVSHLDHMHANVDHGAAALFVFLAEDAPVGDSAAAEGLAFDEHDFAEFSFVAGLGEEFCEWGGSGTGSRRRVFLFLRGRCRSFSGILWGSWPSAFR